MYIYVLNLSKMLKVCMYSFFILHFSFNLFFPVTLDMIVLDMKAAPVSAPNFAV